MTADYGFQATPFTVDNSQLGDLIEALEGIEDRSLNANLILLGAQLARRNNEMAEQEFLVGLMAENLEHLDSSDVDAECGPGVPPPTGYAAQEGP